MPSGHLDADPHLLHHEHLVHPLLGVERPAEHRHARRDPLRRRVPPAVRHERARGPVAEHVRLRRPPLDDEAVAAGPGPLQEPVRQERVQVVAAAARGSYHPHEPVAGVLQPGGDLPHLLRRVGDRPGAAEAEEHHAAIWLLVEPRQALVPSVFFSLVVVVVSHDQWPDAVHRRHPPPGLAAAGGGEKQRVTESTNRPRLERSERVHQYAVGVQRRAEHAHRRPVRLALRVLEQLGHEVRRRHGRDAGDDERGVPELLEARRARAEPREVEEHGERGGSRREEAVRRDPELPGDVERLDRRRVHDHRGDAAASASHAGAEELTEALVVASHHLQVPDDRRNGGRVMDARELVEGDRRLGGGGDAGDGGGEGGVFVHGDVDERDGDGVAVLQEGVGELHHGDEVADVEARVQNDGLVHG
ncbi:Os01g0869450, partial [Oryza sativa Japonica Group]